MVNENTHSNYLKMYLDLLKQALTASIYDESAWVILERKKPNLAEIKNPIRYLRKLLRYATLTGCLKKSRVLVQRRSFNAEDRDNGIDWPLFGYSMAGHKRLDNVQRCIEDILANKIPGDFIETGAWRGGMTIFMRAVMKVYGVEDRKVWVADSFEGLPPPKNEGDGWDLSQVDFLKVSLGTGAESTAHERQNFSTQKLYAS